MSSPETESLFAQDEAMRRTYKSITDARSAFRRMMNAREVDVYEYNSTQLFRYLQEAQASCERAMTNGEW